MSTSSSDGSTLTNRVLRRRASKRALERGGAAGPLELFQQAARAGRLEQQVGPFQRRAHRSTGEGFVRDDLTRVEVDDRLVQGADEATIKDLAQLGGECGLLKQDRGHLPV